MQHKIANRSVLMKRGKIMSQTDAEKSKVGISKTILGGFTLSVLSFFVFFMSGFGYNWDIWGLGAAFQLFKWGTAGGLAGLLVSLIGAGKANFSLTTVSASMSWISMILAVAVVGTSIYFIIRARTVPPIHDITTNFTNPPQFEVLKDKREKAPNEVEYPAGKTAELQKEHYPQIGPLWLDIDRQKAFRAAVESARVMPNWEIHSVDSTAGQIEATHTIMWFGFKDDVIIRIQNDTTREQVRVDMRSASRIGKSDLGVNARRIKRYMQALQAQL